MFLPSKEFVRKVGAPLFGAIILAISVGPIASSLPRRHHSVAEQHIEAAVRIGDDVATRTYEQQVQAWREYMRSLRSPERLHAFTGELNGLRQKFRQGLALVKAGASDEQRTLALFRTHVFDERKLISDMQAAIDAYELVLLEQDRPILDAAGISPGRWAASVRVAKPSASLWSRAIEPVIRRAVNEARGDTLRFAGSAVAADWAGNQIHDYARDAGWDNSKEGSWEQLLTGFAIDVAAGYVMDEATDSTDAIVASLSGEMARAEQVLLDGDQGLFITMRRMKAAHEAARQGLLTTHRIQ